MRFRDNGDGTITDTKTGLMWQKATAPETYDWHKGNEYCSKLKLGGYDDWRLPNVEELQSIIGRRCRPAVDSVFDTVSSWYWSSSTYVYYPAYAWIVIFSYGLVGLAYETVSGYVRAVRSIT